MHQPDEVRAMFARPLLDLVHDAARVHREHHDPRKIQRSRLLSVKTGGCPEDCGYCSQSAHHSTGLQKEKLLEVDEVLDAARSARESGADRFCIGTAWRGTRDGADFDRVLDMVRGIKDLGLEACATLGMLGEGHAERLSEAGLDYYNHNLDTGRTHYDRVTSTRTYDDRLDTLERARAAGLHLCCGGILGLGEEETDRAELLAELANLDPAPESVPINSLVPIDGTPLAGAPPVLWHEVVRVVAVARILMPHSWIRLSAGRKGLGEAAQALCFLAGANSIFDGEELLTTPNAAPDDDAALLGVLGLESVTGTTVPA